MQDEMSAWRTVLLRSACSGRETCILPAKDPHMYLGTVQGMCEDLNRDRALEILSNLIYLTRESAHEPSKVLELMRLAEEQLKVIMTPSSCSDCAQQER